MRNSKVVKGVFLLIIVFSFVACSNDNPIEEEEFTADLIGQWQRSDVDSNYEFKLNFNADNIGFRTEYTGTSEGQATSSATTFTWMTEGGTLTIDFIDEVITTRFLINSDGQLMLNDWTELHFVRIN